MTSALESQSASSSALPGLDHLRGNIQHWDAAIRTLSLTASALAESVAAGAAWPPKQDAAGQRGAPPSAPAPPAPAPALLLLRPPAPPLGEAALLVPASRLKPGRVFVVANLQGAYYTLLELLARHKFDFRSDNLLHLGNLVAPPPPPPPPAAAFGGGAAPSTGDQYGQQQQSGSRRFRNSASVLKLVWRHGGLGPMGANECLTLLAAARSNRQRAEQQQQAAAEADERSRMVGMAAAAVRKSGAGGCRGALSMQFAAVAAAGLAAPLTSSYNKVAAEGTATGVVLCQRVGGRSPSICTTSRAKPLSWRGVSYKSSCSDDSDDSGGEEGGGGDVREEKEKEEDVEMVAAPVTPHRDEESTSSPLLFTSPGGCHGGGGGGGGGVISTSSRHDDAELTQLLSMPACVVLESYGIQLLHAGPTPAYCRETAESGGGRYHLLFSHRRPGGDSGGGGEATATGLASCRDVVRFAVLPPLRTLQRRSPGFGARMAAAAAPSRQELMLQLLEEPLSELDT